MNKKILFGVLFGVLLLGIVALVINQFNVSKSDLSSEIIKQIQDRSLIEELRATNIIDLEKEDYLFSYDSTSKELLVTTLGKETAIQMKLTSPYYVTGLIGGFDTKVAEFLLIDWKDGRINLIDEVNFFDIKDNYKKTDRIFRYKYGVEYVVCEPSFCSDEVEWIAFETLDELPHKNIRIGAFTETKALESIEWIPTINGFEVLQWASYNISTMTTAGVSPVMHAQTQGVFIRPTDGLKAYFYNKEGNVTQWTLGTAWNISTATFDGKSKESAFSETYGLWFSTDGTRYFLSGGAGAKVQEWHMSSAWDVSTATYNSGDDYVATACAANGFCGGLTFNGDGTKMVIGLNGANDAYS